MTEEEWLKSYLTEPMVWFLREQASERKSRLFAAACCRHISPLFEDERGESAIELAEQYADGKASEEAMASVRNASLTKSHSSHVIPKRNAFYSALAALNTRFHGDAVRQAYWVSDWAVSAVAAGDEIGRNSKWSRERTWQACVLRDIFGNPFRSLALDASLLTSTTVALARQMYDSRDFIPAPILADALQDAGCENTDILNHLRGPGPHVRGCWVIDLILGKA